MAPETSLSPPVNISLTVPSRYFFCGSFLLVIMFQGGTSFVDDLFYLCLVFFMLSCLFTAAL